MALKIVLLSREHDRKQFNCGEASLNEWLERMALQQQEKNYARTRVVVDETAPTRILGYYALLPCQVGTEHFEAARKLPKRLPCVLLGRLAIDSGAQGRGTGAALLGDAIQRTRASIAEIGGAGLYADALNARAAAFYAKYGFRRFGDNPLRLFLAINWP